MTFIITPISSINSNSRGDSSGSSSSSSSSTTSSDFRSSSPCSPDDLLPVRTLSATSWRPKYPRIGQFAMTELEEAVAAGPRGLFIFKRVRDHNAKPWSAPRQLPNTAELDNSSVSGVAVHFGDQRLDVYCVSNSKLHSFYRAGDEGSWFVRNPKPPLPSQLVRGTPVIVATTVDIAERPKWWTLVVPCFEGGLVHTSIAAPPSPDSYDPVQEDVGSLGYAAKELGVISAVSIAASQPRRQSGNLHYTHIVAACIAGSRLYTVGGPGGDSGLKWIPQAPKRVSHPGGVTGNPALLSKKMSNQLDLLVPSSEGGLFHFVSTGAMTDEWHMIARIVFPPDFPLVSCLAWRDEDLWESREFSAILQSGGRLYRIKTKESAEPWSGCRLKRITAPGPFPD